MGVEKTSKPSCLLSALGGAETKGANSFPVATPAVGLRGTSEPPGDAEPRDCGYTVRVSPQEPTL